MMSKHAMSIELPFAKSLGAVLLASENSVLSWTAPYNVEFTRGPELLWL